jgi:hypothetical protein
LVCIVALTVAASVWTFAISLPTAMVLDSSANSQAQAALVQLVSSPKGRYGDSPSSVHNGGGRKCGTDQCSL